MMEPDHLNTLSIMGRGWVRLPGSPIEIRVRPEDYFPGFDIRWNPEEEFFGPLRRDADSSAP